MNIRKFSPEDLDEVLKISEASFLQVWPRSGFETNYKKYPDEFIVTDDGGKIAGFLVANNRGLIKLAAVSPDFRGKGVGKSLMGYILNYFKEKGLKEVTAHSRMHNKEGCGFLKSFGFKITETIKNYYQNGEDAYLMVKGLQ